MSNIRDVAKLANVSTATVSRVINHDTTYKMTNETRERVWEAVAQLNYKAPVSLKTGNPRKKAETRSADKPGIGCILSTTKDKYSDPYYLNILSAIEGRIAQSTYHLSFIQTSGELEDPENLCRTFNDPPAGLILMNTLSEETYSFIHSRVPNIVGIDTCHNDIDNIEYDHYDVSAMAVNYLYDHGYREIGFFGGTFHGFALTDSRRYRGYYAAMHAHSLEINPRFCVNCFWDEKNCDAIIRQLYRKYRLPQAFVVASDLMAMAVLRSLYDLHVRVPDDISVIGISNIEMSRYSNPPLTTVGIPMDALGETAVDMLAQRICGYRSLPFRISLPSAIIERSSVGRRSDSQEVPQ